jgi:hypothetical protein
MGRSLYFLSLLIERFWAQQCPTSPQDVSQKESFKAGHFLGAALGNHICEGMYQVKERLMNFSKLKGLQRHGV